MLIVTAKIRRRRIALWALAACALLCCALLAQLGLGRAAGVETAAPVSPKGVRTNEDRVSYLLEYGWQVKEEPLVTEELILPEEFDGSYADYLALQQEQGFDLERYAGKRVKRYTYEVTNYPSGETQVQANLLIYRNTVIAGEVLSPRLDGFLHGLTMPAPTA